MIMDAILPKLHRLSPGTVIPKPQTKTDFKIKGWGKRKGQAALIYSIPNHRDPRKPHQKGVTEGEWEKAYRQLLTTGEFTKTWFDAHLPRCSNEGSCNFTTIGGIFSLFNMAAYGGAGLYRKFV